MSHIDRKSLNQLRLDRIAGLSHVQLGAVYLHKKTGAHYICHDVSFREADMELMVTYAPLSEAGVHFNRPLSEWVERYEVFKHGGWTMR